MKSLDNLTKKELIHLITKIRPKADAYDRICKELQIENNVLAEIKKLKNDTLVDHLRAALVAGNVKHVHDGWEDTDYSVDPPAKENGEWIDIYVKDRKKKGRYIVHLYFVGEKCELFHVDIFYEKLKITYEEQTKIAGKKTTQAKQREAAEKKMNEKRACAKKAPAFISNTVKVA
jgi:hypothetical protein